MKSYQEEIFGPVLQIVRAESAEEAIASPRHQYGNGVALFTRDGAPRETMLRMSRLARSVSMCRSRSRSLITALRLEAVGIPETIINMEWRASAFSPGQRS